VARPEKSIASLTTAYRAFAGIPPATGTRTEGERSAQIIDKGPDYGGKRWRVRYREPGGRAGRQREKSFALKRDALAFAVKVENDKRENCYGTPGRKRHHTANAQVNGVGLSTADRPTSLLC